MTRGAPRMYFDEDWKTRLPKWRDLSRDEWLSQCEEAKQSEEMGEESLRQYYNKELEYAEGIKHWDSKLITPQLCL